MYDKIKQLLIAAKIKFVFIRDLSPTKKQILTAHAAFLDEVEKQFPFQEQLPNYTWRGYALGALAGIFILNGGAVIYADTTDVPLNHPLYSYKRVAEEVRVKTATIEKQPEIEVKIAQRRMKELKQLAVVDQQDTTAPTNDPTGTTSIFGSTSTSTTSTSTNTFSTSTGTTSTSTTSTSSLNITQNKSPQATTKKKLNRKVVDEKSQKQLTENIKKHIDSVEKMVGKENKSNKQNSNNTSAKTTVCKELNTINLEASSVFDEEDAQKIRTKIAKICDNSSNINQETIQQTGSSKKANTQQEDNNNQERSRNRYRNRD